MSILTDFATCGIPTLISSFAGIAGAYMTKKIELRARQMELDAELKMQQESTVQLRIETDTALKRSELVADERRYTADLNAMRESIKADKATYSGQYAKFVGPRVGSVLAVLMGVVDFFRGLARIVLTGLATWVIYLCGSQIGKTGFNETNTEIALITILQISNTIICWWFGSRGTSIKTSKK
jgi:hypothetical protein